MLDMGALGVVAAQELASSRHIEEEIAYLDGGTGWGAGLVDFEDFSTVDDDPGRGSGVGSGSFASRECEPGDAGDAGDCFTAKAESLDPGQICSDGDLAGGVSFEGQQRIVAAHADAVVGDAEQTAAGGEDLHGNARGSGVEAILDEFLDDARGTFDDFTGGDLIRHVFREKSNAVHAGVGERC